MPLQSSPPSRVRKVAIVNELIPGLEALMKKHPGKIPTLTTAVNYVLEAALPLVLEDLNGLSDRLRIGSGSTPKQDD